MSTELVDRLRAASHAYHNGLTPLLMSDAEYDAALDNLRAVEPDHPFLIEVGAPIAAGDEVTLPYPLPSLNKIKTAEEIQKWVGGGAGGGSATVYHISTKLDGCSALWIPAEGRLYTRGDGMLGRDISAFVPLFKGLARKNTDYAVRGELIMRTDSRAIPAGKLARNIVAGALNRKGAEVDPTLFGEIRFVAYELIPWSTKARRLRPLESFTVLEAAGYETALATTLAATELTEARLSELFTVMERDSPYQLDGIVVAPNRERPVGFRPEVRNGAAVNPADRVAWKTRQVANTATTKVVAVEWNVSSSGMLIPRVLFEPVVLAGAKIGAATGLHGRWIYDNVVGPDAVVEVRRAGDVIPQIIAVHVPAPAGAAMPLRYEWVGAAESAVHVRSAEGDNVEAADCIRLTRGLAELGAENVSAGTVARLYAAGFRTLRAIYDATPAEFAARVEGVKGRAAEKIWTGLRAGQHGWTELTFLCASCVMPRGVGHTKLRPLLDLEPNPALWPTGVERLKAARPAGISAATIDDVVACVPAYMAWRTANFGEATVTAERTPVTTTAPKEGGATVVMTGFRDAGLKAALQAAGHTVADTITKKTTHVAYPDGPEPSSVKITKARELGAKIMSASELRRALCG